MSHRSFRILILIGLIVVLFVVLTLGFHGLCNASKNPISATVSNLVEQHDPKPVQPPVVDLLSYDGIQRVMVGWVNRYCAR